MPQAKLTKQSEAILAKLKIEVKKHILTEDEVTRLREGLEWLDALRKLGSFAGILRRFVVGLAVFMASMLALLNYIPGLRALLKVE